MPADPLFCPHESCTPWPSSESGEQLVQRFHLFDVETHLSLSQAQPSGWSERNQDVSALRTGYTLRGLASKVE